MLRIKKGIGLFVLIFNAALTIPAQKNNITAQEIIQRAIDNSGGDARLDSFNSAEFINTIVTPNRDTLSFAIKKKGFNKYSISTLSITHVNSTKIFNNGKAVLIKDELVQKITDPLELEELLLQSYISINYGYKKLKYKLSRLDDQKFDYFDCYVVMAESPLEKKTLNYYDKETGNLIMIIYPNQHKSLFIDFNRTNGIQSPSKVLIAATAEEVTESTLQKVIYDNHLDTSWFSIPNEGPYKIPALFKTGNFKYVKSHEGAKVVREKDTHIEIYGEKKTEYRIKWNSSSDYLLYRLKNTAKPPTDDNIEYIKARIIGWQGNRYYCHYITSGNIGGTCVFERIE